MVKCLTFFECGRGGGVNFQCCNLISYIMIYFTFRDLKVTTDEMTCILSSREGEGLFSTSKVDPLYDDLS